MAEETKQETAGQRLRQRIARLTSALDGEGTVGKTAAMGIRHLLQYALDVEPLMTAQDERAKRVEGRVASADNRLTAVEGSVATVRDAQKKCATRTAVAEANLAATNADAKAVVAKETADAANREITAIKEGATATNTRIDNLVEGWDLIRKAIGGFKFAELPTIVEAAVKKAVASIEQRVQALEEAPKHEAVTAGPQPVVVAGMAPADVKAAIETAIADAVGKLTGKITTAQQTADEAKGAAAGAQRTGDEANEKVATLAKAMDPAAEFTERFGPILSVGAKVALVENALMTGDYRELVDALDPEEAGNAIDDVAGEDKPEEGEEDPRAEIRGIATQVRTNGELSKGPFASAVAAWTTKYVDSDAGEFEDACSEAATALQTAENLLKALDNLAASEAPEAEKAAKVKARITEDSG